MAIKTWQIGYWVLLGLLGSGLSAQTQMQTIIAAEPDGAVVEGSGIKGWGVGWSTNLHYQEVSVAAWLGNGGGSAAGIAYLMRRIGAGATRAEQVAVRHFDLPLGFNGMFTLFSGLDLAPGRYWLIFWEPEAPFSYANLGLGGRGEGEPLNELTLAPGSRYLTSLLAFPKDYFPYPPASGFEKLDTICQTMECRARGGPVFRVTGTLASPGDPE